MAGLFQAGRVNFFFNFIGVEFIYNVVLVSGVQQSDNQCLTIVKARKWGRVGVLKKFLCKRSSCCGSVVNESD